MWVALFVFLFFSFLIQNEDQSEMCRMRCRSAIWWISSEMKTLNRCGYGGASYLPASDVKCLRLPMLLCIEFAYTCTTHTILFVYLSSAHKMLVKKKNHTHTTTTYRHPMHDVNCNVLSVETKLQFVSALTVTYLWGHNITYTRTRTRTYRFVVNQRFYI